MKVTINTDILKQHDLTLGEYLVLLMGYFDINYEEHFLRLSGARLIDPNLYSPMSIVLSDNTKNLVAEIITESDPRLDRVNIDFISLAKKLQSLYPKGYKPGTTYSWGGNYREIAQKLRILVTKYNFIFTEKEAINAVHEYVSSFKDYKYMLLLRNFLLKTSSDRQGHHEMDSLFMSIIENNREENIDEESGGDIGDLEDALE